MKKKGFTLVELLAVIVVISLLAVVAIPSTISISKRVRDKMLNTRLSLAEKAAVMWGQDNKKCFSGNTSECSGMFVGNVCRDKNGNVLSGGATSSTDKKCEIKLCKLALDGYEHFDDEKNGIPGIKMENPSDNNLCINNYTIEIVYSAKTKKFTAKKKATTNTKCNNITPSNYCL